MIKGASRKKVDRVLLLFLNRNHLFHNFHYFFLVIFNISDMFRIYCSILLSIEVNLSSKEEYF